MPSQFQPYYPRSPYQAKAAPASSSASGQQAAGLPIDKIIQAIQQQKQNAAANALLNDPDPDWLYTDAQPAAVGQTTGSYY